MHGAYVKMYVRNSPRSTGNCWYQGWGISDSISKENLKLVLLLGTKKEDKNGAVGQVSSSGMVVFELYFQNLGEKLGIASEFILNYSSRDVVACVLDIYLVDKIVVFEGRFDSNGKVSGYLEEDLNAGLKVCSFSRD
ncbi:hypothetical protein ACH5RR_012381 [Cinchona calisaya]|uniref:Uncharacterized protein n=1 Tax=Cinchona calisaya TaxID=153742 RepID=A0ABD3AAZ2_9GENT